MKTERQYKESIVNHLAGKPYFLHVYDIIAVSNKNPDDQGVQQLREAIVEAATSQSYWGRRHRISWLVLIEKLSDLSRRQPDHSVFTFEEVRNIAKTVGLSSNQDVRAFLQFHHDLGDLIYFDDEDLRDLVIMNPQWLINVFRYGYTGHNR